MKTVLTALALTSSLLAADPALRLPQFHRQVFGNGVVLILAPKPDVPMMTAQLMIRGGAEADPPALAGLASLTADLLRSGTSKRTAEQISLELDALGASFNTNVNRQATVLSAEFLSKDSDKMIDLLADMFVRASFPEAEVSKVLARRIDGARSTKDNPGAAVASYWPAFFYPASHPYSRLTDGDELTLAKINRQAIVDHHKKMYVGKNLILTVSGDFDLKAMQSKLGILRLLGGGDAFVPAGSPALPTFESSRLLLVDKPDATQTYFLIGQRGVDRKDPDRVPLMLVNTLFGGRFTSMLNDELRVNSGLTYGANSRLDRDRLPGTIAISTYTPTDTTEKAIDLSLAVLKRLREQGISAEMLESAKAYVKGETPTQMLETDTQLAGVLGNLEIFGQNRGEVDDLFSAIDAVTVERANEVARKHYQDGNLQFCLVGNAAKIKEAVVKYAPKMKVISIKDPGFVVPEF